MTFALRKVGQWESEPALQIGKTMSAAEHPRQKVLRITGTCRTGHRARERERPLSLSTTETKRERDPLASQRQRARERPLSVPTPFHLLSFSPSLALPVTTSLPPCGTLSLTISRVPIYAVCSSPTPPFSNLSVWAEGSEEVC